MFHFHQGPEEETEDRAKEKAVREGGFPDGHSTGLIFRVALTPRGLGLARLPQSIPVGLGG